jgi:5-methylcytosine-specific restriction endonuclease McrA
MARSRAVPAALRRRVIRRARNACEYCRMPQALCHDPFEMDHIVPQGKGGPTTYANLALACSVCNAGKLDRTRATDPDTGRRVKLFNPRSQRWADHFRWSDDFGSIIGRTPTGRAAVLLLNMNHPRIVRLRRFWAKLILLPPK